MVPVLWKLSLMRERRHSYTFLKLPGLVNFLLVINLLISTESQSCMSVILEAMEIAAILKYKKEREERLLQFHKDSPHTRTQNISLRKNLPLDNLCSLGSPFIVTIHTFAWYLTQSKQLHRK